MIKNECRSCGNTDIETVISLGESPLANNLLDTKNLKEQSYPLKMNYCPICYNCQLSYSVPRERMFNKYLYVSSTTKTFRDHFSNAAILLSEQFGLGEESFVVDIGSNDGVFLKPLKEMGVNVCGVEPAGNLSEMANKNGIPTINGYFEDDSTIGQIKHEADLVTAFNVFAHSDKLKQITENVFKVLKPSGHFIIEVQYLYDTLNDGTFDNMYHEHYNYWSVLSLNNFFLNLGLQISYIDHVDTHGGSIRVYVGNQGHLVHPSVSEFIQKERDFGMDKIETYLNFSNMINERKTNTLQILDDLKSQGKKIIGYGAPAKATTLLNAFNINDNILKYVIDDNVMKQGKVIPNLNIKIISKEEGYSKKPDCVLILAWNFYREIINNNLELLESGVEFIVPTQNVLVINKENYSE